MRVINCVLLVCSLLLVGCGESEDSVVAYIKEMGGQVAYDGKGAEKTVVGVDLAGAKVDDTGLGRVAGLAELRKLNLAGTDVADAGLGHLEGLTKLRSLDLLGTQVTKTGVESLKAKLPKCKVLTTESQKAAVAKIEKLKGTVAYDESGPGNPVVDILLRSEKANDAALAHLEGLTRLRTLNLDSTVVSDAGLKHLKNLTKLQRLSVYGTKVTDAGMKHLTGLTKLEELNVSRTQITDIGLKHVKGLRSLQFLDLYGTKVTDAGVKEFQTKLPKCIIRK
jgi:Leucine-rich repeat (LRR) protein